MCQMAMYGFANFWLIDSIGVGAADETSVKVPLVDAH
jgi:hypothetical protein